MFSSADIHDRFIIKNSLHGKMIGASMQGFGGKIFAMLDIPSEDLPPLLESLRQIAAVSEKPWK